MNALQNVFETNSLLKEFDRKGLTKIIDSFFQATDKHTKANFCSYLKLYEINALFREGKDGTVYGLTFVDNSKCTVFNGRDLGKGYSGQALMKRLEVKPNAARAGEKGKHKIDSRGSKRSQHQLQDLSLPHWVHGTAKEFFSVMKAEKLPQEPTNTNFKIRNKKKKRRGMSL
jgi:hypothetical protein